jgi:hypothetical protein
MKPKLFIGSSAEGKNVADAIQANLYREAECTVWTQGVFQLSDYNLQNLMRQVHASEFGVFVFSPDDITEMRGKLFSVPRDNVVYELGLFSGALGPERCFFAIPEKTDIHLPSDLLGMNAGEYEIGRKDKNTEAAVAVFCRKVRQKIGEMALGVSFLDPKPDAQLLAGEHTFICECTAQPRPNILLFTQKENRWWPRRDRLRKRQNSNRYEVKFWFEDPGPHTIHVVKAEDIGMTLFRYYCDIIDRTLRQQEELKKTGLSEAQLKGLQISYPPITMEELPRGFVSLASITVEVVPKP